MSVSLINTIEAHDEINCTRGYIIVMGCGGRPNHRHYYLERVFAATTLDTTMTYFTK